MKKEKFYGRLPSGFVTHNVNNYIRSWRRLANKVIKNLAIPGMYTVGYEPSILFAFKQQAGVIRHDTLQLTTELCFAIAKLRR